MQRNGLQKQREYTAKEKNMDKNGMEGIVTIQDEIKELETEITKSNYPQFHIILRIFIIFSILFIIFIGS